MRMGGVGVCMAVCVSGWVSEFWTSGIVYMLILITSMSTVCLTQFRQKVDWVSFGKTLFKCLTLFLFSFRAILSKSLTDLM